MGIERSRVLEVHAKGWDQGTVGAELVGVLLAAALAVPVSVLAGEPGFAGLVGDDGRLALADVSTPATAFPML